MATITKTVDPVNPRLDVKESVLVTWLNLANGDQGDPVELPEFSDRTVQIGGTGGNTYGAGTITLEGSNNGVDWFALRSPLGTALSAIATNAMHAVLEIPRFMRPTLSGGAGGDVDIYLMCRRTRGRA